MATFETEERTTEDREQWLAAHDRHHPCLVAVETASGAVAGWISADDYRPRYCYRGVAEFSVYVHEAYRGLGVGKRLMDAFIPACVEAGLWKILSRIFPENQASRGLCAWAGFREVGIYEKHAMLDGEWKDVVIVERLIAENIKQPPADW
jgi:phosphinothricin acetyltransferase